MKNKISMTIVSFILIGSNSIAQKEIKELKISQSKDLKGDKALYIEPVNDDKALFSGALTDELVSNNFKVVIDKNKSDYFVSVTYTYDWSNHNIIKVMNGQVTEIKTGQIVCTFSFKQGTFNFKKAILANDIANDLARRLASKK